MFNSTSNSEAENLYARKDKKLLSPEEEEDQSYGNGFFVGKNENKKKKHFRYLTQIFQFLEKEALEEEGIFRNPGDTVIVKALRRALKNPKVAFDLQKTIEPKDQKRKFASAYATVLKSFFEELEEPVCAFYGYFHLPSLLHKNNHK